MIPEEGQGKGTIIRGLGPLFSGLVAAVLIALTLAVAVALGLGEQALTARVDPTATEALAPPALTLMPLPTYTPSPTTNAPLPSTDEPLADAQPSPTPTASPTPSPTLAPGETRIPPTPTKQCVPPNGYPWSIRYRVERGEAALDLMNRHLEARNWFANDQFSIADIALLAYTRLAHEGGFDLSGRGNVRDWIQRCEGKLQLAPAPAGLN